ncbi:MAG: hypothetical protein AAF902_13110 [Chloroflexota bacterium]
MGRSQITTTDKLNKLTAVNFGNFRRALFGLNQRRAFDELFATVQNNRMAMSQAVDMLPVDTAFMIMLIELKIEIEKLRERVEELEGGSDSLRSTN